MLLAGLDGAVCRADREDPRSVATRNRGKRLTLHAVVAGTRHTCISLPSSLNWCWGVGACAGEKPAHTDYP